MVSVIIVNYFQKELLFRCVKSLYSHLPAGSFEIITVNNSPAEALTEISNNFLGVKIIENENTGFSIANNIAAKQAAGKYLLFLNADTEIKADFTIDLFARFEGTEYGAIGLALQFPDGSFQNSFGLFPSVVNEYQNRKIELAFKKGDEKTIAEREREYSHVRRVDWVTGASLFIKKDVFESVNGFDERFFLYYEDIDLCFRLNEKGFTNYYYPYSTIIHLKGEYTRNELLPVTKKIQIESQKLYYKLHCSWVDKLLLRTYRLFIKH